MDLHDQIEAALSGDLRVRFEKMNRRSQLFETIVEQSANAILITDAAGCIEYVNPAFEQSTGYSRDEVIGRNPKFLKSGSQGSEFYNEMWNAIRNGKIWRGSFQNLRKDGSLFWEFATIAPVRDASGKITRYISIKEDITPRVQAEEALRKSVERFDNLARTSRTFLWEIDVHGKYIYVSDMVKTILGYEPEELVGHRFVWDIHPGPGRDDYRRQCLEIIGQRETLNGFINRAETRNGKTIWLSTAAVPLLDAQGKVLGYQGMDTDITEKYSLEAQFLRAQRLESIGTLAGGIAHDLNNVLSPVLMSIEMLRMGEIGSEKLELLDLIENSARRGSQMVRQILSFARGVEHRKVDVDLAHVLNDVCKIVRETFPRSIRLEIEVAPGLTPVRGDPTQIHQVLLNLCVNARDAMPDGGLLRISADDALVTAQQVAGNPDAIAGRHAQIAVEDTGHGMDPGILEKIFDPFFTTKEPGMGTGLGLSSSVAIVKNHGGFFEVDSDPGRGSCFKVFLPSTLEHSTAIQPGPERFIPRGHGELVLIADDEASIRDIARQTLEAFGYRVLEAEDGARALELFSENSSDVDLLITDLMMPMMDGHALIRSIWSMRPDLPVIAVSGLHAQVDIGDLNQQGTLFCLPKPFDAEVFFRTIRQALDE